MVGQCLQLFAEFADEVAATGIEVEREAPFAHRANGVAIGGDAGIFGQ